jgi:hypothetical protein
MMLETRMRIPQFFNIYRPTMKLDGIVELQVCQNLVFIWLKSNYFNNKFWEQLIFRVSGERECSSSKELLEDQRISQEWRPLDDDLLEPPHLNIDDRSEVAKMISFSRHGVNQTGDIDFDKIVMDATLREYFGYAIPKDKVLLDKKGKPLKKKKIDAQGLCTGRCSEEVFQQED